ncbi:MAG: sodium:proton antiporter [Alphaproteobacteria bacterium]
MNLILAGMVGLLVVAILVALLARRLRMPYTVGLVAAGIASAPFTSKLGLTLSHDLIYLVILPPLLFEAAIAIHWRELRRDLVPVLVLSTVGVVISAVVVAAGMAGLLGWPLSAALLFGVLIAATDPVAVIALFKDLKVEGRLRLLVESESLFNDGVAAVLFVLVLAWAQMPASPPGILEVAIKLAAISGGGIAVGLLVGALVLLLAGRTMDHLVSAALTTVAAYGAFVAAEYFHFSGVLATVAAGLLIGNVAVLGQASRNPFSAQEREFVQGFWEFAAFIANSLIFLLIGVTVAQVPLLGLGWKSLVVGIGFVLLGRLLTVYPLCLLFARSRWAIAAHDQHVLWWGGLRGALALALALSLPASLPFAYEIRIAAFAVVIFSVLFQGLTMPLLLRKTGRA